MTTSTPFSGPRLRRCLCTVALLWLSTWPARSGTKELPDAPDWTLKDVNGKTVRLSEFRGKVVVLNFWASWCSPCLKEIPGLVELQKKYLDRGLMIVGVSMDDDPELAKVTTQRLKITYPVVFGGPVVAAAYGQVAVIPSTFVINKEGKIATLHEGFTENEAFEAEIKSLL